MKNVTPKIFPNEHIGQHWATTAYGDDPNPQDVSDFTDIAYSTAGDNGWHLKQIPVSNISTHHSGHDASDEYISEYSDLKSKGSDFPPIILEHMEGEGQFQTLDGQHRLLAAKKLGLSHINAYIPAKKFIKSDLIKAKEKALFHRADNGQITIRRPKNLDEASELMGHTTRWLQHAVNEHETRPDFNTGMRLHHTLQQHKRAESYSKYLLGAAKHLLGSTGTKPEGGHNDNPSAAGKIKKEELNKAPIITDQDEESFPRDIFEDSGKAAPNYKHSVKKLKDGMFHHVFKDGDSYIHTLSQHSDPKKRPLSIINGHNSYHPEHETAFKASFTATPKFNQGKGYGTRLKELAAKHHGIIQSDNHISEAEDASWNKFNSNPQFEFTPGEIGFSSDPDGQIKDDAEESTHTLRYIKPPKQNQFNKSEDLNKAATGKDWTKMVNGHEPALSEVVDHTNHVKDSVTPTSYIKFLNDPKGMKKQATDGIALKMVHDVSEYHDPTDAKSFTPTPTIMAKPYHRKSDKFLKAFGRHPIHGWATMTTRKLFEAGDIGHICERVSTHVHDSVPLTVHQFEKNVAPSNLHEEGSFEKVNPHSAYKIAIMDYLTGNADRHGHNLLTRTEPGEDGLYELLAIDHETNFQYAGGPKFGHGGSDFHTPGDYMPFGRAAQSETHHKNRELNAALINWWKDKGPKIKEEFNNQLINIKDPEIRNHLIQNFDYRHKMLDFWAERHFDGVPNSLNHPYLRTTNFKYAKPKAETVNKLLEKLPKDNKEALGMLADWVNSKDKISPQHQNIIRDLISARTKNLTADELADVYQHVSANPKYLNEKHVFNSQYVNPRDIIVEDLLDSYRSEPRHHSEKVDKLKSLLNTMDGFMAQKHKHRLVKAQGE